ncbi:ABC transporter substrate-binding protein [Geminicoccus roseus]|uniref:ABC transporter substrate-binding protein n=1 Tax=Geminicoccus roseus TaxID=404900 RepID=UPI0004036FC8|nr:extracellular solute-binding protein [Geminicoccus roseus]
MSELHRRMFLGGVAAGTLAAVTAPTFSARAQSSAPADASEIDLEKAKAEGPLTFYTSLDTKIVDEVIKTFKEMHGIDVTYFRGGSADVTSKVLAEADAGRLQADLVDCSDLAAVLVMKDRGLLRPFKSEAADKVRADLRDPDGTWIADRLTQACIQYNANEFGDNPPKTWQALTEEPYASRLTFFSSANGDGAPRLYTLAQAFGWELLEQLAAADPLRVQSPQVINQLIESGERGVAFCTNDNIAWRSKIQGKPTDYVYPSEGVPTEPGALGLFEGSAKPHAAALFYEYWMSKEGQELMAQAGGKYSSRSDAAPPEGAPPLSDLNLLTIDYRDYAKQRQDILQRMADTFGGEWGV